MKRKVATNRKRAKIQTFEEWIKTPNAFATREDLVAFHNLQMERQTVPLIQGAINRYHEQVRNDRWFRRLWRGIKVLLRGKPAPNVIPEDEPDPEEASEASDEQAEGRATIDNRVRRSCVVCGSTALESITDDGEGLQCLNGHIVEEAPGERTTSGGGPEPGTEQ
jgi:hypothetical protein